jgi:hypothetical protein
MGPDTGSSYVAVKQPYNKRPKMDAAANSTGSSNNGNRFGRMPTASSAPLAPSPLDFLAEYIEAQQLFLAWVALEASARVKRSYAALAAQSAQFGRSDTRVRRARMYI